MKKIVTLLTIFAVFYSCKNEQTEKIEEPILSEEAITNFASNINFFDTIRTDTIALFETNKVADLNQNIQILEQFDNEVKGLIDGYKFIKEENSPEVNLVTYKLNHINTKMFITDLVFWNAETKTPIEVIPYPAKPEFPFMKCPEGWSGGQEYDVGELVTQVKDILSKELEKECLEIRLVSNLSQTKLCYKTCQTGLK